ncbi:MAG TPA: MFS transporter [Burkholderiales bacterium]|nr:MFS transporter [Burkholderiales bacterium]
MSTIVVVRKGSLACIACDTLATIGSLKQKSHYSSSPDKIFQFGDTFIGTVGYAVHKAVLQSYFSRHADDVKLDTPEQIYETWRVMHKVLQDEYHMNPRAETDDAYKTTRMSALLASPRGIFGVTPSRDVEAFPRFWAIGSGASYAVGAMFTLFERTDDVEEIARAGVAAGAEFDDGSELPVALHTVKLTALSSPQRQP